MTERTLQEEIAANYEKFIGEPERKAKIQNLLNDLRKNPSWINGIPEPDVTGLSLHDELQARFDQQEKQDLLDDLKQNSPDILNMETKPEISDANDLAKAIFKSSALLGIQNGKIDSENRFNPVSNVKSLNAAFNEKDRLTPLTMNDKYKHAVVSCTGAQGGIPAMVATGIGGLYKEIKDISEKIPQQWNGSHNYGGYSEILKDSFGDLKADGRGLWSGYNNPNGNCKTMMTSYYNPYVKK